MSMGLKLRPSPYQDGPCLHLTIGFSSPLTSFTAMLLSSKKAHPFNIPTKPPHHQEHLSLQEVYLEVSRGLQ